MKNTSWGAVADWYDGTVNNPDSYQNKVILPNILRIVEPKSDLKVLDIGSGQGFFSHHIALKGAMVTGVDVSEELTEIAKKGATKNEEFFVAPAESFSKEIKENDFDIALSVLAIQNMEHIATVFREVAKSLKSGGKFIIVLNHPSFRIPKKSSWGFDEAIGMQYRRVDEYLSESRAEIEMNPGKDKSEKTVSFHRPLQVYSKTLHNAGFAISRIEEWTSHRQSEAGPKQTAENKARKEIPLFLCLEAIKL